MPSSVSSATRTAVVAAALAASALAGAAPAASAQETIYSNVPGVAAANYPSVAFQSQFVREWGDRIAFAPGTSRSLQTASVVMSTWALATQFPAVAAGNPAGWTHPITFNLYAVGGGGAVGALLATRTVGQLIPWRPESDPTCTTTSHHLGRWRAADGTCNNGAAFRLDFDFGGVTVPDEVIFSLAYDGQTSGYAPTGVDGPYNWLNVASAGEGAATVGATLAPGATYVNRMGIVGGSDTFEATAFAGASTPMVSFTAVSAVPEPGTWALLGTGLLALGGVARRRKGAA